MGKKSFKRSTCFSCTWIQRGRDDNRPKCIFPEVYGYTMASDPEDTNKGVKVALNRLDTPALHGMQPFNNVTVEVEFQTDNRLRIKVDLLLYMSRLWFMFLSLSVCLSAGVYASSSVCLLTTVYIHV